MIRYYDASFFHDMVTKRDYKMISIFEVFALNRNEEDFLENLFIFKDLVSEEQDMEELRARNGGATTAAESDYYSQEQMEQ